MDLTHTDREGGDTEICFKECAAGAGEKVTVQMEEEQGEEKGG